MFVWQGKDGGGSMIGVKTSYGDDVFRIMEIAAKKCNLLLTLREAEEFWENHSENISAQWLILPEKDEDLEKEIKEAMEYDEEIQ